MTNPITNRLLSLLPVCRLFKRTAAILPASSLLLATAKAKMITFEFTGAANRVGSSLAPYFQVGDLYTLTLSYDTTAANTGFDNFGRYNLLSAPR